MSDLLVLIMDAALINNMVVDHLIGLQACSAYSRRLAVAWNIAIAVLAVVLIAAPINYLAYRMLIVPFGLDHSAIIIYVVNIFLAVQVYNYLAVTVASIDVLRSNAIAALILLDAVVIGAILLGAQMAGNLFAFLLYTVGAGVGFGSVLLMVTCLRARIQVAHVPASLNGLPILFVTLAIISMAFTGFAGISK